MTNCLPHFHGQNFIEHRNLEAPSGACALHAWRFGLHVPCRDPNVVDWPVTRLPESTCLSNIVISLWSTTSPGGPLRPKSRRASVLYGPRCVTRRGRLLEQRNGDTALLACSKCFYRFIIIIHHYVVISHHHHPSRSAKFYHPSYDHGPLHTSLTSSALLLSLTSTCQHTGRVAWLVPTPAQIPGNRCR